MRLFAVHRYELACRLIEAVYGVPRPPGVDPRVLIDHLDGGEMPGLAEKWLAAADAACEYIIECVERAAKGDAREETDCSRWPGNSNTHDTTH